VLASDAWDAESWMVLASDARDAESWMVLASDARDAESWMVLASDACWDGCLCVCVCVYAECTTDSTMHCTCTRMIRHWQPVTSAVLSSRPLDNSLLGNMGNVY